MKKYEMDYLVERTNNVVKCTNGNIHTILNNQKKGTGLTDAKKFEMVSNGKAILKHESKLSRTRGFYDTSEYKILLTCFDYPKTKKQQEKINFNEKVDKKIEEITHQVELEGKRIIDRAVLGIIEVKELPEELHRLSEMANLARK